MRAGPLSDPQVTKLLNEYFVPISVSNEDYSDPESTPAEEHALYKRIFESARSMNKPIGLVHVYIFNPNGDLSTSKHVKDVRSTENLLTVLHEQIREHRVQPGKVLEAPKPQLVRPPTDDGELLLHYVARVEPGDGAWPGIAEDMVHLAREDWQQLVGAEDASPGSRWTLPEELAQEIFTNIYPSTDAYDPSAHIFHKSSLTARVVSVTNGTRIVALDGEMSMDHGSRSDNTYQVNAVVTGYVRHRDGDASTPELRLSTFSATYGEGRFDHVIFSEDVASR